MTTTRSPVQELAKATAETIRFRGWVTGTMADIDSFWLSEASIGLDPEDGTPEEWFKTCSVCLAGGVAAAALGDPRKADDIYRRGEDWDNPEVDALFIEIADRAGKPSWRSFHDRQVRRAGEDEWRVPSLAEDACDEVTTFNDTHSEAEVLALLDAIAGQ